MAAATTVACTILQLGGDSLHGEEMIMEKIVVPVEIAVPVMIAVPAMIAVPVMIAVHVMSVWIVIVEIVPATILIQ